MPFIGKEPQNHYITPTKDSFNGDASTVAFTLSRPVALPSDLEVFVDNVQQEPTSAYTVNGTTMTFTGTPATGTNNIYAIHRGGGMQTLQPQDGQAGDFSTLNASGAATLASTLSVTGASTLTGTVTANGDMTLGGATPTLTIGDAGAEDTKIVFDGNAADFHVGLDDTDDKLKIGLGSALGTTPILTVADGSLLLTGTTPSLTIGDAGAEDTKIVFDGNAQDFYIGLDDSADDLLIGLGSAVGTTPAIAIDENLQITTGGDIVMGGATPTLTIGDAGAEDAKIVFDGNAQDFHIGLDDSADDLVIGKGSALGTTPAISIAETLKTTFGGGAVGATFVDATNTGNITLDYDLYQNFVLTFTGNVVLVNPTTESVGQSGVIVVIQDGTGSRTIAGGTQYEWPGGAIGTISTAANSVDIIPYFVDAADSILLGAPQLAFATPS
jgi:hypothetical protein